MRLNPINWTRLSWWSSPSLYIELDDLTGPEVAEFLSEHLRDMRSVSPPESVHALDLSGLQRPEISFWTVRRESELLACGALKQISLGKGEIKSMRTSQKYRGQGMASMLLLHIIEVAKSRNYSQLYLETGSMSFFLPAQALYKKHGFTFCPPFGDYREDPNSVFMVLELNPH